MDINAVCEKKNQAEALAGLEGIKQIFHPGNTLPYVFRNKDAESCKAFLEEPFLLARNLDGIGFLRDRGYKGEVYADHSLYTYNPVSRRFLRDLGIARDTAPLELSFRELMKRGAEDSELMIYGRVPMMISAGCIYRNTHDDRCRREMERGHDLILTDRMNADFPVLCVCRYCYNIILNSVPLSLHGHMDKVLSLRPASVRLYFTTETPSEVNDITRYFINLLSGKTDRSGPPYDSFTKGHFIKGVE